MFLKTLTDDTLRSRRGSYPARSIDPEAAQLAKLTGRESQILALMADRLTNPEISARLGRELATIEKHVENLYRNLHVNTRADAIALVLRREVADAKRENERLRFENSELREKVAQLTLELAEVTGR